MKQKSKPRNLKSMQILFIFIFYSCVHFSLMQSFKNMQHVSSSASMLYPYKEVFTNAS